MAARKATTATAGTHVTAKPAPKTAAKPAPKATATRATSRSKARPKEEEDVDLLSEIDEPDASTDDDDDFDLLDEISEENGESWQPANDEDQPRGIQGTVTYRGTVDSDFHKEPVNLVELRAKDGTEWSIRGYHSVLENQIDKADPEVGDLIAVKYLGEKDNKRGDNTYHDYRVVVRKK